MRCKRCNLSYYRHYLFCTIFSILSPLWQHYCFWDYFGFDFWYLGTYSTRISYLVMVPGNQNQHEKWVKSTTWANIYFDLLSILEDFFKFHSIFSTLYFKKITKYGKNIEEEKSYSTHYSMSFPKPETLVSGTRIHH